MELAKYTAATPLNGYTNQILWIKLGAKKSTVEIQDVPEQMRIDYQGGRGYAVKILYDNLDKIKDPLGPENHLIIGRGPMTGEYRWPGGTKTVICAISPATNGYGEASVGGRTGEKMRNAGFDAVCITGKVPRPSTILVDATRGVISLEDDPGIEDSVEMGKYLVDKYGKENTGAFTIGIAGRKLARIACVNGISATGNQYIPRQAGRTGMGGVMGSKNIVAIVFVGNDLKETPIADPRALMDAAREMRRVIKENDKQQLNMIKIGTSGLVDITNKIDVLPVRNFAESNTADAEYISGAAFMNNVFQTTRPCSPGCNLGCGKRSKATLADGREVEVDGPEYETIGMLGSNLGIFDANFVAEANYMCDTLGLDTISTGYLIGYVMECFEKGYLTTEDTDGIELMFGDKDVARQLITMIAQREGIGNVLADGILRTIDFVAKGDPEKKKEIEEFALHVKGLELSAYIPRTSIAQQVAYATSLIGAHHREAWLIMIDAVKNEIPEFEQKADILVWFQNIRTWVDMAGFCKLQWIDVRNPDSAARGFPSKNLATVELYIKAINAVTGLNWTMDEHFQVSIRAYNVAKMINIKRGLGRKDDHLCSRAMGNFTQEDFDKLLDRYYELRGWDNEGVPKKETLADLGIDG
ncbi:MAG TPA: aldehyde ferredoxin oxidoreductase C-terminal domain-containing protein [Candidatus Lokiarchaeia archaeon]|nr:aldehyde ferredoxin oxidoreductase C-terminal domain-containing protein [Candidatus Lokiarchaeia archaeon]